MSLFFTIVPHADRQVWFEPLTSDWLITRYTRGPNVLRRLSWSVRTIKTHEAAQTAAVAGRIIAARVDC